MFIRICGSPEEVAHTLCARPGGEGVLKRGTCLLDKWPHEVHQTSGNESAESSARCNASDLAIDLEEGGHACAHKGIGDDWRHLGTCEAEAGAVEECGSVLIVERHFEVLISHVSRAA